MTPAAGRCMPCQAPTSRTRSQPGYDTLPVPVILLQKASNGMLRIHQHHIAVPDLHVSRCMRTM